MICITLLEQDNIFYIDNVLSEQECQDIIYASTFNHISKYVTDTVQILSEHVSGAIHQYRNNNYITDSVDTETLDMIYERIKHVLPITVTHHDRMIEPYKLDSTYDEFELYGLNKNSFVSHYTPGGHFSVHIDGREYESFDINSIYSIVIYLNDSGSTLFYHDNERVLNDKGLYVGKNVKYTVNAVTGRCIIFKHENYHAGSIVTADKYILRTDAMYKRVKSCVDDELFKAFMKDYELGNDLTPYHYYPDIQAFLNSM